MSSERSLLLDLPGDCLGVVTNFLRGDTICLLFNLGSKILRQKLSQPGCVSEFRIHRRSKQNPSIILPSIAPIVEFQGLRTLSIKFHRFSSSIRFLCTETLSKLPKSLLTIEFYFIHSEECWLRATPSLPLASSSLSESRPPFNFGETFPLLRSLHLLTNHPETVQQSAQLRESDLLLLPRTLTSLKLPANGNLTTEGLAKLPNGLTVLCLRSVNENGDWQKNLLRLPLRILKLTTMTFTPDLTSQWPFTLEILKICSSKNWKPEYMSFLPSTLNKLHLKVGLHQITSNRYPKQLSSLALGGHCRSDDIERLPRNLIILDLLHCPAFVIPLKDLPPRLTCLRFPGMSEQHTVEEIMEFPRTLRVLSMHGLPSNACKALPLQLEELWLYRRPIEGISKLETSILPEKLWNVVINGVYSFRLPSDTPSPFRLPSDTPSPLRTDQGLVGGWKSADEIVCTSDLPLLEFVYSRTHSALDFVQLSLQKNSSTILRYCLRDAEKCDVPSPFFTDAAGWPGQERIERRLLELMITAARFGSLNVLKVLHLEFGIPLAHRLIDPGKLLQIAVANDYYAILDWLVELGHDMLVKDQYLEKNIFHLAASKRSTTLLEWLKTNWQFIEKSSNAITWCEAINMKSFEGQTPLSYAKIESVASKNKEVINWLLSNQGTPSLEGQNMVEVEEGSSSEPDDSLTPQPQDSYNNSWG